MSAQFRNNAQLDPHHVTVPADILASSTTGSAMDTSAPALTPKRQLMRTAFLGFVTGVALIILLSFSFSFSWWFLLLPAIIVLCNVVVLQHRLKNDSTPTIRNIGDTSVDAPITT